MTCGFSENLKCKRKRERKQRIVSPPTSIPTWERNVLAWTVRWVLSVGAKSKDKSKTESTLKFTMTARLHDSTKTFVLYRTQMLRLLTFPKPVFDQLAIELPCLMAFRPQEVASWMATYIDFQRMNTLVMDSKKKTLFTVPLNMYVAKHAEEVLNGRSEGFVLRSRSNRNLNQQVTPTAIWYIWDKWTKKAGLPNAKDISPTTGRRFFSAEWYYSQGLSLVTLQMILRHSHFETTLRYVRGLVFYEDMKRDYDRFSLKLMEELDKKEVYA